MTIYDLKPRFQSLLRPACRKLASVGVTANQVTVSAVFMSAVGGASLLVWSNASWPLLAVPVVLFVRMALNAIDGMLAREFAQKSRLGAVLNELGDVVSDLALYLPLAMLPEFHPAAVVVFVCAGLLTEYAGVQAIQIGADRRYDGPFGKSDRAFLIGLLSLLNGFALIGFQLTTVLLAIASGLSVVTVRNRVRAALDSVPSPAPPVALEQTPMTSTDDGGRVDG